MLFFTASHLWVKAEAGSSIIGFSSFGRQVVGSIGKIVFPLPLGSRVTGGSVQVIARIETPECEWVLRAPLSGKVVAYNDIAITYPDMDLWWVRIEDGFCKKMLMTEEEYTCYCRSEASHFVGWEM